MKKIVSAISLFVLFYFFKNYFSSNTFSIEVENIFLMGIILLTAFLIANSLKKIQLPKLTGFMLTGMLVGPNILNFLTQDNLKALHFFENFALAFIALTAGGELKFSRIKKIIKPVSIILFNQIFLVFFALLFLLIPLSKQFLGEMITDPKIIIGFSILFAATALSKSPATTMGIITELKAKGRITDIVLSVTVLKAIIVVLIFPVVITYSKVFLIESFTFEINQVLSLILQVMGSLLFGVVIGFIIIVFLKYIKIENALFLFLIGIVLTELSGIFDFEILISSMVAGIVVENFSKKGNDLISGIEKTSLPLYIIFFTFAGASLHLGTLQKAFMMTLILIILRMLLLYLSNFLAGFVLKEDKIVKHYSWLGFIGQAGIAVGLANIIERSIPGELGSILKSLLIATVVINEFLGPILFKYLLVKAKENYNS
ncbi:MAG: hypothetical protein GXO77_04290 [Calditrichaeota bacterium]|nr:hypothetical protein [Calditrichota bacterium]